MKYISTRGKVAPLSFCDILLGGLAEDGGLFLPESYPQISLEQLKTWQSLSYAELAFEILRLFATDIPEEDLRQICVKTYSPEVFAHARQKLTARDITPITWTKEGWGILELSNGPTLAFKDMAMQLLGNLFEYELARRGAHLNILGATSGDTGSAAEYAMRGKAGVRVFMLSPEGKMSAFQRAQMYSLHDDNIFNLAIRGMFDDAQDVVKAVSNDHEFKKRYAIGAVNSINWGRIAAQIVYYFKGYLAAVKNVGDLIAFAVPSGNFGNICAGHIARMMGLPIGRLILATNENDVLDEFFRTGRYRPRSTEETFVTSSPSMDISKASNFERFIFDLTGRNSERLCALWQQVEQQGGFDLAGSEEAQQLPSFQFVSGKSTHADRLATIRSVFESEQLWIDPHTADAVKVAREVGGKEMPIVVLETAQAIKFAETMQESLNQMPPRPSAFEGLEALPQRVEVLDADAQKVKEFIRAHV